MSTNKPSKTPGQIGYEAYALHTDGKTFDGRNMPPWSEVCKTHVGGAWEAAAAAILVSTGKFRMEIVDL